MKMLLSTLTATLLLSQTVFAGADCPAAPKNEWLSELDMQKRIINEYGYSISKFKIDDNCYEIYGKTAAGKKVEIYFNPTDGDIVKKKYKN